MKSRRGTLIKLKNVNPSKALFVSPVDNCILISDKHKGKDHDCVLRIQAAKSEQNAAGQVIAYPVMYSPEMGQDEMILPVEVSRHFGLKLEDRFDCELAKPAEDEWVDINKLCFVIRKITRKEDGKIPPIEVGELASKIQQDLRGLVSNYPLHNGQILLINFRGMKIELRVDGIESGALTLSPETRLFRITDKSQFTFKNETTEQLALSGVIADVEELPEPLTEISLDFTSKGIGGFKEVIARILQAGFYTRALDKGRLVAYDVNKHAKGIMLYGPPGTGKTLLAKCICEQLSKKQMVIVNGPELKNSYYGATQRDLAATFAAAIADPANLYVYFFDEADAAFGVRGTDSSVSTSNNSDLVTRLGTIIDGAASPQNIFIIFATNRRQLIDPALLRAGRIDTHIFVGMPDEGYRLEILKIHTKKLSSVLAADVDLALIAKLTRNYSGAELARLVRVAREFALINNFEEKPGKLILRKDLLSVDQYPKITQQHFLRAIQEVKPVLGLHEDYLKLKLANFSIYDENAVSIMQNFQQCLNCLNQSSNMQQLNFLISGTAGSGKTSLAMQLASQSGYPHIQVLSGVSLLPHSLTEQLDMIDEVFERARQSVEPSVIVLNNLEQLIEATPDYAQFNNRLRLKFNEVLMSANGEKKVLIIATTENRSFLERVGLAAHFNESAVLPLIHLDCSMKEACESVVAKIGKTLDIRIENNLAAVDANLVVDISIKDLIYQMRKFVSMQGAGNQLKLSNFLNGLPEVYKRSPQSVPVVLADHQQAQSPSLFGGARRK